MAYDMEKVVREAKRRRKRVLRLRQSGKTLKEIAKVLGVSKGRAQALVDRAEQEAAAA